MNHEQVAAVGREENTDTMATIGDFAFEELEDRLEQVTCWHCVSDGGWTVCWEVPCSD